MQARMKHPAMVVPGAMQALMALNESSIKAGLPKSVQATTVNKVCGSGMQTVIMGAEAIAAGSVDYVIAGGMESMTNAPYILKKHRSGARIVPFYRLGSSVRYSIDRVREALDKQAEGGAR